jgi:Holliday junction resolvase RusA-like endonuclease
MRTILDLTIPGVPIAQPRVRATAVSGRPRMYTPAGNGVHAYKAAIRLAVEAGYRGPLLAGPVRIDCQWVFARPQRLVWKRRAMPRLPHDVKPDRDNLDKAVLDALRGCLLTDDAIVTSGYLAKWYAAGDERPHTRICVYSLD